MCLPLLACGRSALGIASAGTDSDAVDTSAGIGTSGDVTMTAETTGPVTPTTGAATVATLSGTDASTGPGASGETSGPEITATQTSEPSTGDTSTSEPGSTDVSTTDATTEAQTTGPDPGTGGQPDTQAIAGYPAWVHFANPLAGGSDPTILDEVVRLIDNTPDDGTIRAAIHSLTVNTIATALIDARARGVKVLVAEDGSDAFDGDPSPLALQGALGADHVFCGDKVEGKNYGCITGDPSGRMHTKLYTFSQTRDPDGVLRDDVVWFGSANMTQATGTKTFNNALTIYGDVALYDGFNTYFGQLFAQEHYAGNDFFDADLGRGYLATDTAHVYASPDQDGDLVQNRLDEIDAGDDCELRVAQSKILDARPEIVDRLIKLEQGGCAVKVVAGSIEAKSLAKFKQAGVVVRTNKVHDKLVIVQARLAGSPAVRYLVFTGSHDWTYSANYRNDELFVRVESQSFHGAYVAHFNDAFGPGAPL